MSARGHHSVKPNGNGLVRLTNSPARDLCPDYSRDGRLITFCSSRSGPFQIWAMNADGTDQQRLLAIPLTEYVPSWAVSADKDNGDD